MQPFGVRRIRSENTDGRRAIAGNGRGASVSDGRQQRMYDVDDVTSLEKHRLFSSMEKELLWWRERASTAIQDALYREQEVSRCKSEHATVRQHLEGVIRDLLEKQKTLSAELHQSRQDMQLLRDTLAAKEATLEAARETQQQLLRDGELVEHRLHDALEAGQSRETETAGELSVVMEKLTKADMYIQTLSDEAVTRQLEIEQLRAKLASMTEGKSKSDKSTGEENRKKAFRGMLAELTRTALVCADSCDEMSRECEELIDVVREEQERHSGAKEHKRRPVTFISCKPTGAELEHLLHATLPVPVQQKQQGDGGKDDDANDGDTILLEVTLRVVAQLLQGMQKALQAGRDDVLVAGRAYAELCRACRDTLAELATLQSVCREKHAAVSALEEQLRAANESMCAERKRADHLQASMDDSAGIMEEAAALAEERTGRMDKLLHDNMALEEALQALRRAFRERDDASSSGERKLRSLQEELRREQTQCYTFQEELHRVKRASKTLQEERDEVKSQLHELEHHMQGLKDESRQCDVDRLYLRKQVEELQGQLEQLQRDRQLLRDSREAMEWEKRQLLLQVDRLKRDNVGCGSFATTSPTAQQRQDLCSDARQTASVERYEAISSQPQLPQSAQAPVTMNKVQWWEAKLQAITSSSSAPAGVAYGSAAWAQQPPFLTSTGRHREKVDDPRGLMSGSTPPESPEMNHENDVL